MAATPRRARTVEYLPYGASLTRLEAHLRTPFGESGVHQVDQEYERILSVVSVLSIFERSSVVIGKGRKHFMEIIHEIIPCSF